MDQSRDFIEQCSGMHFENQWVHSSKSNTLERWRNSALKTCPTSARTRFSRWPPISIRLPCHVTVSLRDPNRSAATNTEASAVASRTSSEEGVTDVLLDTTISHSVWVSTTAFIKCLLIVTWKSICVEISPSALSRYLLFCSFLVCSILSSGRYWVE